MSLTRLHVYVTRRGLRLCITGNVVPAKVGRGGERERERAIE